MDLTEQHKQQVSEWIAGGMKLSDIQSRLATEFDVRLTYMEARLLVDDLKLTPKDPEPPKTEQPPAPAQAAQPALDAPPAAPEPEPLPAGKVTLSTDALARPGTVVSGTVTFSDGKAAKWYLDQLGRLGVVPEQQDYRPPQADFEAFQVQLDRELQKMGY